MIDGRGLGGALFMAACLVVAGIFSVIGGTIWLIVWLCQHVEIRWVP